MPSFKYVIELSEQDRGELLDIVTKGASSARKILRANILLGTNGQSANCVNYTVFVAPASASASVRGDVNADGVCNVLDVILLQKWILNVAGATLADPEAGDLYQDGVLDVFDLCMMKRIVTDTAPQN